MWQQFNLGRLHREEPAESFGYLRYGILLRDNDEEWYNTHATSISLGFIPLFHSLGSVVDIPLDFSLDLGNDEKSPNKQCHAAPVLTQFFSGYISI